MTVTAALLLPVGVLTLFRSRRLYARIATLLARAILRLYGVRVRIHQTRHAGRLPRHADGLHLEPHVHAGSLHPRCPGFAELPFLSQRLPAQVDPAWVHRLDDGYVLHRSAGPPGRAHPHLPSAGDVLRRTGESVYLSPEGGRITSGEIGHFNKGAFHLATVLRAPIVPMYFHIPREVDPGLGYQTGRGVVDVYVLPAIHTTDWTRDRRRREQGEGPRDLRADAPGAAMRVTSHSPETMIELLRDRATAQGDDAAFTFLEAGEREQASLSWRDVDARSRAIGAVVAARVEPGARVLILLPPSIDFVAAFFGVLYAGTVAIPAYPPSGARADRSSARLRGMISDAGVTLVLSSAAVQARAAMLTALVPELAGVRGSASKMSKTQPRKAGGCRIAPPTASPFFNTHPAQPRFRGASSSPMGICSTTWPTALPWPVTTRRASGCPGCR